MIIEKYLKKHGITQVEFAKSIGITQSVVSQWLTGRRPISAKCAKKIDEITKGEVSKIALRRDIFG